MQGPTQPSFQGGDSDAFVVVYAPGGARGFGTYLGGSGIEYGYDVAVDGDRSIYFAGSTSSTNFPTVLPVQAVYGGGDIDAYAVRLFPNGSSVAYSTFLGGNLSDSALAIDLLGDSDAYLAGGTRSTNFPLVSPYQAALRGSSEVFISRITDPTPPHEESRSITYTHDPLYRLTAADYDDGTYFHYTYDAVGNRITETTEAGTTTYVYDSANRLTSVGGVPYTWSDNGNLLSDGATTYAYDHADRLATAVQGVVTYVFSYNGLGSRVRQTINTTPTTYALDLEAGLTQVLSDGTSAYLYGNGRVGEEQPGGWQYHLGDALGSLRQLVDGSARVTFSRAYEPFGDPMLTITAGSSTVYGFTGEQLDGTGLVYLRARYYAPRQGRFLSRDVWEGDTNQPMSYNAWLYAYVNPVRLIDPRGLEPCGAHTSGFCILSADQYGGVALDIGHFRSSWAIGTSILSSLGRVRDTQQQEVFPVTESQVSLGPLHRYLYSFSRTYWASIPSILSNREVARVGLGIFMDFQYGLEAFQRFDPRCWMVPPVFGGSYGHCSSFSNEDLPSDYLGYVAAAQGHSLANALSIIVEDLGGGEHATHRNPIYSAASRDQMFMCSWLGVCDEHNSYNACYQFKVFEPETQAFVYVPWPRELSIDPIAPGVYWKRVSSDQVQALTEAP